MRGKDVQLFDIICFSTMIVKELTTSGEERRKEKWKDIRGEKEREQQHKNQRGAEQRKTTPRKVIRHAHRFANRQNNPPEVGDKGIMACKSHGRSFA